MAEQAGLNLTLSGTPISVKYVYVSSSLKDDRNNSTDLFTSDSLKPFFSNGNHLLCFYGLKKFLVDLN